MLRIVVFSLALVLVLPCCGQVEPSASGGPVGLDDTHMMTPPPVSSESYPTSFGSESQSDFLAAGVIFTSAYVDNLMIGETTSAVSDVTYAILPTVNLKRKTPRQVQSLVYNSGFTFYQHTSDLNAINQNAEAQYQFHPSAYSTIAIQDSFSQNSNAFNQNNPNAGGSVSGSPQSSSPLIIVPFQKQLANSVSAGVTDQFGKNAMVGGAGSYSFLHYSDAGVNQGLYDSGTAGGSGFYSRRLTPSQYLGGVYQFSKTVTHPVSTFTTTYSILGFYTLYLNRAFSFSVVGGPQHFTSGASTFASSSSWFDWIIIDSPPVLPLADTSVWTNLADGILLVTRQGTTQKKQLQRGLEALGSQKLIGAILNSSKNAANSDYYYRPTNRLPSDDLES